MDSPFYIQTWRSLFKSPSELIVKPTQFIVNNFLPEGITFLGGPPGHGKSWVGLSLAKAIWSGSNFLKYPDFLCPHAFPILYLSPEVNSTAFKGRLDRLGLGDLGPDDGFLCRTLSEGTFIKLDNQYLRDAVKDLKPVVFLDTLTRFNTAEDENSSTQISQAISNHLFDLQSYGARAILPIHHSTKELAKLDVAPGLENVLRGTGDLAAIADAVYCIRTTNHPNFIADVTCVKNRDFEAVEPFEFQGRPYINEQGDLEMTRPPGMEVSDYRKIKVKRVSDFIQENQQASHREIARECGISKSMVSGYAKEAGFTQKPDGIWCPTRTN